ncbi:MAG: Na+/H+ antiporter NhaC, partial [Acidobacteria bacterium]|nr:Na+/H+ antiporter NhaC [Acidobacteriota bacterium]
MTSPGEPREPSFGQALVPVALLLGLLALAVYLFGADASFGPNQIALILAAAAASSIGLRNGHRWTALEAGITRGVSASM